MFPQLTVGVALLGSALAGLYDLKTTEIPDWISLGMVATGLLINLSWSVVQWNPTYIFQSAAVGSVFFTFGLVMYMAGQWGGGDAKVLTGIGTLVPSLPAFSSAELLFPFSATLLVNVFVIGAVYMIVYAVVFSLTKKGILADFKERTVSNKGRIALISLLPLAPAFIYYVQVGLDIYLSYLLVLIPTFALLLLLMRFLKAVEDTGFEKEIAAGKLEPGDMLADEVEEVDVSHDPTEEIKGLSRFLVLFGILPVVMYLFNAAQGLYFYMSLPGPVLGVILGLVYLLYVSDFKVLGSVFEQSSTRIRGLEEEEVEKVQENRDKVKVREGVRFVPAFPMALAFTLYYGNFLMLLL